jgi:hypothetical protein
VTHARAKATSAPMVDTPARAASLDDAIHEATNERGLTDPHEAAAYILSAKSDAWIGRQMRQFAAAFIADRIRLAYRSERNRRGTGEASQTWKDAHGPGMFVPEVGWKRLPELTEADCRALAVEYRKQSQAFAARAVFFDELADKIAAAGVARVADLGDEELAA